MYDLVLSEYVHFYLDFLVSQDFVLYFDVLLSVYILFVASELLIDCL